MFKRFALVFAMVLLLSVLCFAQTGTVTGFVYDDEGQPVAGARVMLRSTTGGGGGCGGCITTAEDGSFTFEEVDVGEYVARAMKCGVGRGQSDEFEVVEGETVNIEITLTQGGCGGGGGGGGGGCHGGGN